MRFVYENRASRILYNLLSTNSYERPFLVPANVCGVIPSVFSEAQIRIEFADSSKAAIRLDVNSISNIYSAIYSRTNPLNLHDKIILKYNDDQSTEITVELIQYRYMI